MKSYRTSYCPAIRHMLSMIIFPAIYRAPLLVCAGRFGPVRFVVMAVASNGWMAGRQAGRRIMNLFVTTTYYNDVPTE